MKTIITGFIITAGLILGGAIYNNYQVTQLTKELQTFKNNSIKIECGPKCPLCGRKLWLKEENTLTPNEMRRDGR